MPYKSQYVPINNEKLDRRVKLTTEDKQTIIKKYETGMYSINGLAREYGVDKRLIQYTLFPERLAKSKEMAKERRKDGRYYDREKHVESMRKHRRYKHELFNNGLIGEDK